MAQPQTVTVKPTSEHRRAFQRWTARRGVRALPSNAFAVPVEQMAEVPPELLVGAVINGTVYLPEPGDPGWDAPPVDDAEPPPWIGEARAHLEAGDQLTAQQVILAGVGDQHGEPVAGFLTPTDHGGELADPEDSP